MTDPHRPDGYNSTWRGTGSVDPSNVGDRSSPDPAYAGQLPTYPAGNPPPTVQSPAAQQHWRPVQPPGQPPSGGPGDGGTDGAGEPPRFPSWLWLLAGSAVLLVVGLVIALVLSNGSARKSTTVSPVSPLPTAPGATAPTRAPTTTPWTPSPTTTPPPPDSTSPGNEETVIYSITGGGRAISIAYLDTGGVLQTEFNVVLPWNKQVSLTPSEAKAATVTVVNIGEQITCSVTVNGTQLRQRTGTILTVCAAIA
ncbi:MAG: MmpS family transport accessory protein [Mycobacterium sp.]